jgi:hypothetical protein
VGGIPPRIPDYQLTQHCSRMADMGGPEILLTACAGNCTCHHASASNRIELSGWVWAAPGLGKDNMTTVTQEVQEVSAESEAAALSILSVHQLTRCMKARHAEIAALLVGKAENPMELSMICRLLTDTAGDIREMAGF